MEGDGALSPAARQERPPRGWAGLLAWCLLFVPAILIHPDAEGARSHPPGPAAGRARGPNILIIVGDDHGGMTLGCDGDPRRATPRLDALAGQGVRFSRAYCNAPLCSPSRQSMLTGRLPHAVGSTRLLTPLPADAITIGDWLGDLGYDTAAYGKLHFNSKLKHGFYDRLDTADWRRWLQNNPLALGRTPMRWRPFADPPATWLNSQVKSFGLPLGAMESSYYVDRAVSFLGRHKDRGRAPPFAMVVGFYEPHAPFKFPDDWTRRYDPAEFPVSTPTEADRKIQPKVFADLKPDEIRGIQAAYFTSLSFLDHQVGRILDALDASGLADDTIVVYLGDNGYILGQHGRFEKHCFFEPAVRVPLIFRWPGHLPAGRKVDDLAELVDVLPTVLDLADQPRPPDLHGLSLRGAALGDSNAPRHEVVVGEYLENEEAMVRTDRYKLIVGVGGRQRRDGYGNTHTPTGPFEHLYDLEADPGETVDLATRADLAPVRADLRARLLARLASTREGRIPVPPGLPEAEALRWCLIPQD